jgi:O-antigen ligase
VKCTISITYVIGWHTRPLNMEIILLIAAVAALVWGTVVFLRGGLMGGCLTVLLIGACFSAPFNQYYHIEAGFLTVDRLLVALLAVQYVLWRRWGWADPKPVGKPEILLLVFLAFLTASTFLHDWRAKNCQPVSWLILYYVMPVALYWIARQIRYSQRTILTLFGALAVFSVYLAVTSLAEYFEVWWLVYPKYIVTSASSRTMDFVGRGRGPMLNPISNGILLAVGLGALLMWWPRLGRPGKILLLAALLLILAAIYFGLTRSVWLGGMLVLAIVVGLALPWSWRWLLLGGAAAAVILLAVAYQDSLLAMKRDKSAGAEASAGSVELRPILATITWKMFLDHPVFGCGFAQHDAEHRNYTADRSTSLVLERGRGYSPHNFASLLLVETGLVGLGLFASILFFWGRDAWRLWRDVRLPLWTRQMGLLFLAALGVYLVNGMFHDVSVVAMVNMTFFFLAGAAAGLRTAVS